MGSVSAYRFDGCFRLCRHVPPETLEKEHLARYCINYSSYLVEVGKYLEALENLETAAEVTTIAKTKNEALLSKATLLTAFLDAPEDALKILPTGCRQ